VKKSLSLKFKKHGFRFGALALTGLVLVVSMQNCSNVNLAPLPVVKADIPSVTPPGPRLEPVLATRNTSCLMCHAQINGDLISDFGAGSSFVLGTDNIANHPQQSYYSPFQSKHFIWGEAGWNGSSVMGNIYVPDLKVTDARMIAAYAAPAAGNTMPTGGVLKIIDFLKGKFLFPATTDVVKVISNETSADITKPGLRGQFYSRKTIWIDSPSADEVRSLMQAPGVQIVKNALGALLAKNAPTDTISGLNIMKSSLTSKNYFTNDTVTTCKGDIIVDGILFLNNLILNTDNAGCRLYVTGSVFIQGPIIYPMGGESNLQISSASAIFFGMKDLTPRLTQLYTSAIPGGTRTAPNDIAEIAQSQAIINDAMNIDGLTNDAGPWYLLLDQNARVIAGMNDWSNKVWDPYPGFVLPANPNACVAISDISQAAMHPCSQMSTGYHPQAYNYRKTMSYTHLLLNAPKIHSRYYGIFKGVIIGEDVLFSVNNFKFEKDPVMIDVELLPLLNERVFKMSDD
jgi:hypothetical protein